MSECREPYCREIDCVTVGKDLGLIGLLQSMDHTTVYIPVDENVIQVNVMLTNPVCVLTEDATRDLMTSKLPFYFQLVFGNHSLQNRFNTNYINLGIFCRIYTGCVLSNHFLHFKIPSWKQGLKLRNSYVIRINGKKN